LDFHKQEIADKCIADMLAQDVIVPSDSPWASPVVLLQKKDGNPRFAIDYRRLNQVTRKDAYPLPRIDETLDSLRGASWFSSLDLRAGYWNIPLSTDSQPKTAFCLSGHGLYEFKRMPFGLCNAPATFQRLMDRLMPRNMSRVYLDVIVPGRTFEEALTGLKEVLERVRKAKFLLHPGKCNLLARRMEYLGHVITGDGITTDKAKTEKVRTWPVPVDKKDLNSFLSLAQYYAKFVRNFQSVAAPLNNLTRKCQPWVWSAEAQAAFDQLRVALTSAPILAYPLPNAAPFVLDCDASNFAIGAVLSQEQRGQERVIAYYSKTLNRAERNYCVTRRELYAVVQAIRHFHPYLSGRPFLVRTDHAALQWLRSLRDTAEGQLARWLERLAAYDFSVQHRPGREHGNADALSRRPCDPDCRHCARRDVVTGARVQRTRLADADAPTTAEIRAKQTADLDIAPILLAMRKGERPTAEDISDRSARTKALWLQWKSLRVRDGLLYRYFEPDQGEPLYQLVAPRNLLASICHQFHDAPGAGGHLTGSTTLQRIREHYYWPGMRAEVKLWCHTCITCRRKKGHRRQHAPLQLHSVGVPWERVGVDLAGPFTRTDRGNRYLLVVVDYFTRWPEAIPIASTHAEVVARALVEHVFSRFGVPAELHSDRGSNFESNVFRAVMELMGIRKTRTTPQRPQSNGAAERLIQTVITHLAMVVNQTQKDWDLQVPLVLMSLRASPHATTGVSPAMMLYGRQIGLPPGLARGYPPDTPAVPLRLQYPSWLQDRLHDLHHAVRDRAAAVALRQKERYDVRTKRPTFRVGDRVWLFDPRRKVGRSPKLDCWWTGPWQIVDLLNDVTARIRDPEHPRRKTKTYHVDRLAHYIARS
jgi:transposase InsO family protein